MQVERLAFFIGCDIGSNMINFKLDFNTVVALYNQGMNCSQIAKKLEYSNGTISLLFKQNNFIVKKNNGRKYPIKEREQEIVTLYKEGKPSTEIAEQFDCVHNTVLSYIRKAGIVRSKTEQQQIYKLNHLYFDQMNSNDKWYWLGFLYADGYNNEKKSTVALRLASLDRSHIELFKKYIETESPIVDYDNGKKTRMDLYNQHLSRQLVLLGCVQAKTHILEFPQIPEQFLSSFLLGYFDGDGSIWESGTTQCMEVAGTEKFLLEYQKHLMRNCQLNQTKLKVSAGIHVLSYGGRTQLKRIFDFLYKDHILYLKRKYDKWQHILDLPPKLS
jgi:DNA-binding CsgD family transcriptional regulator